MILRCFNKQQRMVGSNEVHIVTDEKQRQNTEDIFQATTLFDRSSVDVNNRLALTPARAKAAETRHGASTIGCHDITGQD